MHHPRPSQRVPRSVADDCVLAGRRSCHFCIFLVLPLQTHGSGPGTALFSILLLIHNDFACGLGYFAITATTVSLLNLSPQRTEREALVWIHYSILIVFCVYEVMYDRSAMIFMGLLAGALLGHPVIGMVGGLVCSGSVTALFLSLLFGCIGCSNTVHNVLLKVPCLVIGGCGLVSIGRCLTKHRAFLCFHLRRLCRALVSMR